MALGIEILFFIPISIFLLIIWMKQRYSFWKSRGLITPPYIYFLGNFRDILFQKETLPDKLQEFYNFFKKKNVPHGGIYSFLTPHYFPIDLNIIKTILRTNFENFMDRGVYMNEEIDPLSSNLFTLEGAKWKGLRKKISPTFTPSRMKMMFEILVKCSEDLTEILAEFGEKPVDIKNISSRYTMDVIGNCALGIECNSLREPNNIFEKNVGAFFNRTFMENVKLFFADNFPTIMKFLGTRVNSVEVSKFIIGLVRDTIDFREKNNIIRKDFMHSMMQLKNSGKLNDDYNLLNDEIVEEKDKLTLEEIGAQCFLFFLGGFDTSASTMSFCLFLLGVHRDIQNDLRKEIVEIIQKNDGKLTFESLAQMVLLEKVINETMRLYPIIPFLIRKCTKDFPIPNSDLVLKKGQQIFIPTIGLHYDEDYFPEPRKFDPERFSEENIGKIDPSSYLPFGDGPRNCIARRFGMMQTKVGLIAILREYEFFVDEKTRQPLKFDSKNSMVLSVKDGIWLRFKKINN